MLLHNLFYRVDLDKDNYTDLSSPSKFLLICQGCHNYFHKLERQVNSKTAKDNPQTIYIKRLLKENSFLLDEYEK